MLIKHPYDPDHERARRRACEGVFRKTAKEEQEDAQVETLWVNCCGNWAFMGAGYGVLLHLEIQFTCG